jgi:hypothetical protein
MAKKIIVIGEKLNDKHPRCRPFSRGQTARRVWKWLGYKSYREFREHADAINIIPKYLCSNKLDKKISKYKYIILLGRIAQRAVFDIHKMSIRSTRVMSRIFVMLPHPSGLNISCNHKDEKIIRLIESLRIK